MHSRSRKPRGTRRVGGYVYVKSKTGSKTKSKTSKKYTKRGSRSR